MRWISAASRNYLADFEPFQLFDTAHALTVIITLAISVGLPIFAKRFLGVRYQILVGVFLGVVVAGSYIVWIGLEAIAGTFSIGKHLPLHLCWAANRQHRLL